MQGWYRLESTNESSPPRGQFLFLLLLVLGLAFSLFGRQFTGCVVRWRRVRPRLDLLRHGSGRQNWELSLRPTWTKALRLYWLYPTMSAGLTCGNTGLRTQTEQEEVMSVSLDQPPPTAFLKKGLLLNEFRR